MAVDCNWIAHYNKSSGNHSDSCKSTVEMLMVFKEADCKVIPVCDGLVRNHTKCASIKRRFDTEILKVKAILARTTIVSHSQKIHIVSDASEKIRLENEINECKSAISKAEKITYIPEDFLDCLQNILHQMNADKCNENGGTIDDVVTASFQADLVIAKMVQNEVCDMIVANDVSPETSVMGGDRNRVRIVSHDGVDEWPDMSKTDVAQRLANLIAETLEDKTIEQIV